MKSVGESLRQKREERGLSLKDVELALSIRVKYLAALEDENYNVIPGEVYVKGFLRNYANFLGLNGEEIVQLYKDAVQPNLTPKTEPTETKKPTASSNSKGMGFVISAAAVVGIIIISTVYYLYAAYGRSDTPVQPNPPALPSKQLPTPSAVPIPENTSQPIRQGVRVAAKINAECWMQVFADGKEVYEGVLQAGDVKTWEAKQQVEVTLGNAAGAQLTVNDQIQPALGKSGEVVKQVYKAQ